LRHDALRSKLEKVDSGLMSGDPSGYSGADVLAAGSLGHAVGVAIILGLKQTGAL